MVAASVIVVCFGFVPAIVLLDFGGLLYLCLFTCCLFFTFGKSFASRSTRGGGLAGLGVIVGPCGVLLVGYLSGKAFRSMFSYSCAGVVLVVVWVVFVSVLVCGAGVCGMRSRDVGTSPEEEA